MSEEEATYLIRDGVRRAKAMFDAGFLSTSVALFSRNDELLEIRELPFSQFCSPKSHIDVSCPSTLEGTIGWSKPLNGRVSDR